MAKWVWLSRNYFVNRWSAFFAKVTMDSKVQWWAGPSNKAAGRPEAAGSSDRGAPGWSVDSGLQTTDICPPAWPFLFCLQLAHVSLNLRSHQMPRCQGGSSLEERPLCGSQARGSCYPCMDRGSWQSFWGWHQLAQAQDSQKKETA